jgi:hypothetical protein
VNLEETRHINSPIAIIECPPTNKILYFINKMVKIAQIAPKKFADAIIILIEELAIKSS